MLSQNHLILSRLCFPFSFSHLFPQPLASKAPKISHLSKLPAIESSTNTSARKRSPRHLLPLSKQQVGIPATISPPSATATKVDLSKKDYRLSPPKPSTILTSFSPERQSEKTSHTGLVCDTVCTFMESLKIVFYPN